MFEITCPHCGKTITEDESKFASVVRQVRDREFDKAVAAQAKLMEAERASAVEAAAAKARQEARDASAEAVRKLEADAARAARDADAAALKDRERIAQLEAQLAAHDREAELTRQNALAEANARIAALEQRLKHQEASAEQARDLAVAQASVALERERDAALRDVQIAQAERLQAEAKLAEQKAASEQAYKQVVAMKDEEIARIKEMRSRLTTKLIGESLEQHCEAEFNRLRATAFRTAEFHKDNEAVDRSKGDYVFRDFSEDGEELVSIMFEMKTEEEGSDARNRRTNESHLKKLDQDRRNKGCEYAVLVSTLEAESELYNQGIVDVSYLYPKMYVIRPQFFIPLITLLRDAGLKSADVRRELARARAESVDVTNFEAALGEFKNSFALSYENAAKRFDQAMDDIDKTIRMLEKIKDSFRLAEKHLGAANNKADRLTIKRLTRESPSLRERFAEQAAQDADVELEPDEVELPGEGAGEPEPEVKAGQPTRRRRQAKKVVAEGETDEAEAPAEGAGEPEPEAASVRPTRRRRTTKKAEG